MYGAFVYSLPPTPPFKRFKNKNRYGIRLKEKRGLTNGFYKETKLFWCPDKFGVVVQKKRISARYLLEDFDFSNEVEPEKVDPGLALIKKKRKEIQKLKKVACLFFPFSLSHLKKSSEERTVLFCERHITKHALPHRNSRRWTKMEVLR